MARAKAKPVDTAVRHESAQPATKRPYVRQADIPKMTLEEALKLPQALQDEFAGKPTPPHRLAMAVNLSHTSTVWESLCGAAIGYGLTEGGARANVIALGDIGKRIVAPVREGQDNTAMVEAALKPAIAHRFYKDYHRARFPQDKIAKNVLAEMGVPQGRVEGVLGIIKRNGEFVGIIQQGKTGPIVDMEAGRLLPGLAGKDEWENSNETTGISDDGQGDDFEVGETGSLKLITPTTRQSKDKVFISHGKNKAIVSQLKELLTFGKFEPLIAVEHETTAIPVPQKVFDDMHECFAGIIHVASEEILLDQVGNQRRMLNENVLIEIGAAMALYGKNVILLVQKGVQLPSNLQGLYRCEYEGEKLDYDATMKLLRTFNEFRSDGANR